MNNTAFKWTKFLSGRGITEIAQLLRADLKKLYPECKFSIVVQKYAGWCNMTARLMSSPYKVFRLPTIEECNNNPWYLTGAEQLEYWERSIENWYHSVNQYYIEDDVTLSEKWTEIMKTLNECILSYHFDDSDSQTDYFHTNFYYDIWIGRYEKWYLLTK
jgi:hypothetical protein